MDPQLGKLILILGVVIALVGLLVMAGMPLGPLPGDLRVEGQHSRLYVPIASAILISLVLTVLLNFFLRPR